MISALVGVRVPVRHRLQDPPPHIVHLSAPSGILSRQCGQRSGSSSVLEPSRNSMCPPCRCPGVPAGVPFLGTSGRRSRTLREACAVLTLARDAQPLQRKRFGWLSGWRPPPILAPPASSLDHASINPTRAPRLQLARLAGNRAGMDSRSPKIARRLTSSLITPHARLPAPKQRRSVNPGSWLGCRGRPTGAQWSR